MKKFFIALTTLALALPTFAAEKSIIVKKLDFTKAEWKKISQEQEEGGEAMPVKTSKGLFWIYFDTSAFFTLHEAKAGECVKLTSSQDELQNKVLGPLSTGKKVKCP